MKIKTIDGNEACANTSYLFTEMAGIYPITPSTPMAEYIDEESSKGRLNLFNDKVKVVEMQSEAGAAGFVHGSLSLGILTSTYTASQGLLLMIPNMYKIAGEMLPLVMHVASRSLATHSLSILGDHQDIYAARSTGFIMISSTSVQDASFLSGLAHLTAIEASLPVMHFFEGFRTSHEINKINVLEEEDYKSLVNYEKIEEFRTKALNPLKPTVKVSAEDDDVYFQMTEARNMFYDKVPDIVNKYMMKINEKANTEYKPFNYYGNKNAKYVIVAMGSVCDTTKEVIDELGEDYGLIEVHLYRPFSKKYFFDVLPTTVEKIAVLDRTKEFNGTGEPLYLDVKSIVEVPVFGGRYGLSSKNTTPKDIKVVFSMLKTNPKHNFTIGIVDDLTNTSLEVDNDFKIKQAKEFLIYGYGSDGMVSASKSIIKLVGEQTNQFVQGYFQYDSKKSGSVTVGHLRFSDKPIRSRYYVENPYLVVCTKEKYLFDFDMLNNIEKNGIFILNTTDEEKVEVPEKVKDIILEKNIKFYTINAYKLAATLGLKDKISTILETVIIKLSNAVSFDLAKFELKKIAKEKYFKKGDEIVQANYKAIDEAENCLHLVQRVYVKSNNEIEKTVFNLVTKRRGNELTTKDVLSFSDGHFMTGTSSLEKRMISEVVPLWNKEKCINCNMCGVVCPHGVIRPYLIDEEEYKLLPDNIKVRCKKPLGKDLENYYYMISISVKDCTGCGLCINACIPKDKALTFNKLDDSIKAGEQEVFDYLSKNIKEKDLSKDLLRNTQFYKPKFAFSGACAGCGETPYIKMLTQLLGDNMVIANATGCSSIFGGYFPSISYDIPWANSLFEDNAEFGYGMLVGNELIKERIRKIFQKYQGEELIDKWLQNSNDYKITKEVYDKLDYNKFPEVLPYKDYIVSKTIWTIGGDGWAYDIGYSGIDHVLSTNDNINILVLDTQVYSNTGGQSSKSSPLGSVSAFTAVGKKTAKKDLARIALSYPHVYVATVSLGYSPNQLVKAFNEASSYDGPSIIIAYAPCTYHGIKGGLSNSIESERLATKSGYFPIFRYNPTSKKFTLDSKDVDFNLYDEYLNSQSRYSILKKINPTKAETLLKENKENAIERFEYYKSLEK